MNWSITNFARWQVRCDAAATREAYAGIATGSAERCSCSPCRNFAALRDHIYPLLAREIFEQLGIRYDREAEIYHARMNAGVHSYGGWFHFVGQILSGEDLMKEGDPRFHPERVDENFAMGFTARIALLEKPFADLPVAQLEFFAESVPWVLEEPEAM